MGIRITDRNDWFEIWFDDKTCMIEIMTRNMTSDLNCEYDLFGSCIQNQIRQISEYKKQFDLEIDTFKTMNDKQVNRWCFYDLKKRGVIE